MCEIREYLSLNFEPEIVAETKIEEKGRVKFRVKNGKTDTGASQRIALEDDRYSNQVCFANESKDLERTENPRKTIDFLIFSNIY